MLGDRVSIAGHAVLYMEGRLFVGGERRGGATT
jgi:hypothetical protein